jgi:hypothetical protein
MFVNKKDKVSDKKINGWQSVIYEAEQEIIKAVGESHN